MVVHLQSGHGLDDVALVQAGAKSAVGMDYSQVAVRVAPRRRALASPAGRYLAAAVPGVPLASASADLVYTGKGPWSGWPIWLGGLERLRGHRGTCSCTRRIPR